MKKIVLFGLLMGLVSLTQAQITSNIRASSKFSNGDLNVLIDDDKADKDDLLNGWLGFEGENIQLQIKLDSPQKVREIKIGGLRHQDSWVFLPQVIEIKTIDINGEERVYNYQGRVVENRKGVLVRDFTFKIDEQELVSTAIAIKTINTCPDWHSGKGKSAWLFLDEIQFNEQTTELTNGKRGLYFEHDPYTFKTLPKFKEVKNELPVPFLEDNKEWLDVYWFCWELAFNKLRTPEMGSPFVSNYIDEAFSSNVYQWDTHFMILFWKYAHHIFPSIKSHDNFYAVQHSDGYICREISEIDGSDYVFIDVSNTINPPLFPWVELEYSKWSKDKTRFKSIIPVLEKYAAWIEKNRKQDSQHQLYWQTNLGSGMDNSPRRGNGWVDMSAQMALFYSSLAEMCEQIGEKKKANKYRLKSKKIAQNINEWMWDDEKEMYYDVNYDGLPIHTLTIASFWPLLSEVPNEEQKNKMILQLQDTNKFWTRTLFPTLSKDHKNFNKRGDYWLGGVWAPTNYMVLKGLNNYKEYDVANKAALIYLKSMYEVFENTGTVWENYSPMSFQEGDRANKDFVGWTGLGPISLLIEDVIGVQLDRKGELFWNISRIDKHGVNNLTIGKIKIDLLCGARSSSISKVNVVIKCSDDIKIKLRKGDVEKVFELKKGSNIIQL